MTSTVVDEALVGTIEADAPPKALESIFKSAVIGTDFLRISIWREKPGLISGSRLVAEIREIQIETTNDSVLMVSRTSTAHAKVINALVILSGQSEVTVNQVYITLIWSYLRFAKLPQQ